MYFSKPSLAFTTILLLTPLAHPAPLPQDASQAPLSPQSEPRSPTDQGVINSLNYQPPAQNPQNKTCPASDDECVMGGDVAKRDSNEEEHQNSKRQMASNGVGDAIQREGINDLNKTPVVQPQNSTSDSEHPKLCSAADTACVVGKRGPAEAEAITKRIQQLEAELHSIKQRRAASPEAEPEAEPEEQKNPDKRDSSYIPIPGITSTSTGSNSSNSTTGSSSTSSPLSTQTNAFGRAICQASDVECVTGGQSSSLE